ncbi:zinc finger protein 41-like [Gouania willdenowi]|uniref:zinc finger protein 41-like n=1 Tax=Gouania willdenowi TaxID=441366 RepID=UPI0010567B32|nr:zinc finger protein 41-like [Gouania willdenowi]
MSTEETLSQHGDKFDFCGRTTADEDDAFEYKHHHYTDTDVPDGVSCKHGLQLHIKKEEEESWESLEEKQETDIMAVTVKSEDEEEEEEAQCSLLHWRQSEENIKGEPATCCSAKLMKVEPDGEETESSDTEDSDDWREPLSEAQSEHMDMRCESFKTSENNTKRKSQIREKRFGCDICGKRFTRKTSHSAHVRIHTGEKPFGCDVCGKRFCKRYDLKVHVRIHTGEKPYSCDVCGKRFTFSGQKKRHMSVHTKERLFGSDIRGNQLRCNANVKNRVTQHTRGNICNICGQHFTLKPHLTHHMRIHNLSVSSLLKVSEKAMI